MLVRLLLLHLLRLRLRHLHRLRLEFREGVRARGVLVGIVELV